MSNCKQFDEEIYESWHIEYYKAEEIAEGLKDPEELIGRLAWDKEPNEIDLDKITKKLKELGYDTFEIIKEIEHRKRYVVE